MEGQKENSLLIYIFFNKLKGNFKMLGAALPISITSLSNDFLEICNNCKNKEIVVWIWSWAKQKCSSNRRYRPTPLEWWNKGCQQSKIGLLVFTILSTKYFHLFVYFINVIILSTCGLGRIWFASLGFKRLHFPHLMLK